MQPPLLPWLITCCVILGASCAARTPVQAPELATSPLPLSDPVSYALQIGDELAIKFWGIPELDQDLVIRPDGRISLPFIDEVQAAGLTPAQLDDDLTRLYAGELKNPQITIIVRQALGHRVFVGGEVAQQGPVPIVGELTLLQAVQQAGGFLPSARRRQVLLIRTATDGTRLARSLDIRPALSGERPDFDPRLQTADIVFVPRTKISNVDLFVEQYINRLVPIGPIIVRTLP